MNIVFVSANRFGYEIFKVFKSQLRRHISTVITLAESSPIKMYDHIFHPCFKVGGLNALQKLSPTYPWNVYQNGYEEVILVDRLNDVKDRLIEIKPDYIIVAGWREIISEEILAIPKYGVIGFHPTLLPYGRGPAPIINSIWNKVEDSGLTMFYMDEGVDSGPIIAQEPFKIAPDDNALAVYMKVIRAGINMANRYAQEFIEDHTINSTRQDEDDAHIFPALPQDFNIIGTDETVESICRKVRAVSHPYTGAYLEIGGKAIRVWDASGLSFECRRCDENCHLTRIPWWGNRCLAKKVSGECFKEIECKSK